MKSYKQLLSELSNKETETLSDLLGKLEGPKRTGFKGSMGSNPDSYLDDMGRSLRSPASGTALSYRQERKGASGILGGLIASAAKYGADFYGQHGWKGPVAGELEKPLRTYDPKSSIKANERGGEIRKQIMIGHRAEKQKIDAAHAADLSALRKKKGSMDAAAYSAKVTELGQKRQAAITALSKQTAAQAKATRTRAADLKSYYGYKGTGQNITPDTNRGFEGGYERY